MSDIIKVNKKYSKAKPSFSNVFASKSIEENEKDKFQLALQNQYSKGYSEGEKMAKTQLESEFDNKISSKYSELDNFILKIDNKLIEYEAQFENLVTNVAFVLAEKILKKELQRESIIHEVLDESLKKVIGANEILVHLNPKDYESIISEGISHKLSNSFTKIRFEKDDRIEIGGCLVESEIGNADGRLSSQLNELRRKMDTDDNAQVNKT